MATIINARDVILQSQSTRTQQITLPSQYKIDSSQVDSLPPGATYTQGVTNPNTSTPGNMYWNSATSVMWFKETSTGNWIAGGTLNASQINAGTLSAVRIASGSIDASKLNVGTLSSVSANLGSVTAGNITGTANININGSASFQGSTSDSSVITAVLANSTHAQENGIRSYAGSNGGSAVYGNANNSIGDGFGGFFRRQGGTSGAALHVESSTSAPALEVVGSMTISSATLVSNLRAATCLLADNSTKWNGFTTGSITTGSSTGTFNASNKPGSNSTNSWWIVSDGATTIRIPVWTS